MIRMIGHYGRGGAAVTGLAVACVLAMSAAVADTPTTGSLTVTVYGGPATQQGAAPGAPGSAVGQLTPPGLSGAQVYVSSLDVGTGMQSLPKMYSTDADGKVEVGSLPPGNYAVGVYGNGRSGEVYLTVGAGGGVSQEFSVQGLPLNSNTSGPAVQELSNAAIGALNYGNDQAYESAMSELQALSSQDALAIEQLGGMAESLLGELPPLIRSQLERDFAAAESDGGVADAIRDAEKSIERDVAEGRSIHEAAGLEYETPQAVTDAQQALRRLKMVLKNLKEHQLRAKETKEALKQIAEVAGDKSHASAGDSLRMNTIRNAPAYVVRGGPPVRATMPTVPHPPVPVHVEPPRRGGMTLSIPGGG